MTVQNPVGSCNTQHECVTADGPEVRVSADGLITESEYYCSVMFSFPPDAVKVLPEAAVAATSHTPPGPAPGGELGSDTLW